MGNKLIIFDFLRTIYDPDRREFIEDAIKVVKTLRKRNKVVLYTSREGDKNRDDVLGDNKIYDYFDKVYLVESKKAEDFEKIALELEFDKNQTFVVGDRIQGEIFLGNKIKFKTVWFRNGKYKDVYPKNENEKPDYLIYGLKELLKFN